MDQALRSSSPITSAWFEFIQTGNLDEKLLRPEVAAAWRRCREAGLDPFAGRSTRTLEKGDLARLLEKRSDLINIARPFMGNLYQFVASSSFGVVLCDERGYLMETLGAPEVIGSDANLNFIPGAVWTEAEIGNNGVGSALVLGRPFQVSGAEHYCMKHHPWTCSGAPIRDEWGQVIGILEMSGPVESTHQHTLGMVVAAAEAIRQQLRVQTKNRELMLVNSHLNNIFLSVSDGVVVVDADGVIRQINPVAENIFSMDPNLLIGRPFTQFLDRPNPLDALIASARGFTDLELNIHARTSSALCLASAKTIRDEQDRITNHVIFLNPIHRVNRLINRFSGAHAAFTFDDIIGNGKALKRAILQGNSAAASDTTVLLCGESGTGKEMFAQAIHNQSARRQGPFIAINCGAIPRELVGSELFGYVEGAFTGALKRGRPGKFELAAGGTLFLDEVGDMPLDQQVSLLRVLQDKTITRIGGDDSMHVDVRIIAATNKNLLVEIAKGNFRQDLYYRLNIISINLPPLRDHKEDIPLLFKVFSERLGKQPGFDLAPAAPGIIHRLQQHQWPGNIREFQNFVEKLVNLPCQQWLDPVELTEEILTATEIRVQDPAPVPVPRAFSLRDRRSQIRETLKAEEQQEILDLMGQHKGNLSQVARAMGMSRTTLYKKIATSTDLRPPYPPRRSE
ncbi:MAG: sigma-54-dependent Fis family transcriptional regulator [Holophaga sp.]|nr:sigma-54-dependent Fis family transcriptional regulator [Holophaga sp.]